MTRLLVLHGFTQNGELLRSHLAPLLERLPPQVDAHFPNGPHTCSDAALRRLTRLLGVGMAPPPNLCWWDATDDGREYRGWEATRTRLQELAQSAEPVGVLGFSQGAILAATLSGLAARGEFPPLQFAVLVAGKRPRATVLQPLFDAPIALPSLHVWGERDAMANDAERLVDSYAAETREVARWNGPHVVPTYGPGADAIARFIARYAT